LIHTLGLPSKEQLKDLNIDSIDNILSVRLDGLESSTKIYSSNEWYRFNIHDTKQLPQEKPCFIYYTNKVLINNLGNEKLSVLEGHLKLVPNLASELSGHVSLFRNQGFIETIHDHFSNLDIEPLNYNHVTAFLDGFFAKKFAVAKKHDLQGQIYLDVTSLDASMRKNKNFIVQTKFYQENLVEAKELYQKDVADMLREIENVKPRRAGSKKGDTYSLFAYFISSKKEVAVKEGNFPAKFVEITCSGK